MSEFREVAAQMQTLDLLRGAFLATRDLWDALSAIEKELGVEISTQQWLALLQREEIGFLFSAVDEVGEVEPEDWAPLLVALRGLKSKD